jgi:predicted dinucleotide-binding enzyme
MKVAILGSGQVGRTLGAGFLEKGHEVVMGTRDPESEAVMEWLVATGPTTRATSYAGAAAWCEFAAFVPVWTYAEDVVRACGPENLAGKIVMDVTNPLGPVPGMDFGIVAPLNDGAGSQLQRWLPEARVVKAFNTVGYRLMIDPQLPGGPPTMPICGGDDEAKRVVAQIAESFGWEPADFGGISFSGYLDALGMIWMRWGAQRHGQPRAFKILHM